MELTRIETMVDDSNIVNARDSQVRELSEAQLALVGGGSGDTIAY